MAARLAITAATLDLAALTECVSAEATEPIGAVASFAGLVRATNAGRRVRFLDYEAYEPLAVQGLERIEREVLEHWPGVTIGVHHRTGRLEIGEASILIVAASAHRAPAFAACRYVIERVKQILPIWKHEHFEGGETWVEGATVDPDDPAAAAEALRRACA